MTSDQEATPGAEIRPLKWPERVEVDGAPAWVGAVMVVAGIFFAALIGLLAKARMFGTGNWVVAVLIVGFAFVIGALYQWGERIRGEPVRAYVRKELEGRDEGMVKREWGEDQRRQEVAMGVGRALARELKWPNGRFVPGDELRAVTFLPGGVDIWLGVMLEIERETGLTRGGWDQSITTVGAMVDWLMGAAEKATPAGRG